jgi:methylated-DNA-[protein]-cysteine S-methyltransferase
MHKFTIFDTPIGRIAIAWSPRGVVCVQLPEASERKTVARLVERFADAEQATAPPAVQRAIDDVVALLSGERRALAEVELDMDGVPPFHRRVYEIARAVAPGETVTYGEIARRLGARGAARAVGQALGRNPFALVVPCHRVIAVDGGLVGFSAAGGTKTKARLIAIERAAVQSESEGRATRVRSRDSLGTVVGTDRQRDASLPARSVQLRRSLHDGGAVVRARPL